MPKSNKSKALENKTKTTSANLTLAKPKLGRPTMRNDELTAEILHRLAHGETLTAIARLNHMPDHSTIYDWIRADKSFADSLAHARDLGFDAIAQEALDIANTPLDRDEYELDDGHNIKRITRKEMLGHRRLQVDTRLKLLAKWCPSRYGDRVAVTGVDDAPPVAVQLVANAQELVAKIQQRLNDPHEELIYNAATEITSKP